MFIPPTVMPMSTTADAQTSLLLPASVLQLRLLGAASQDIRCLAAPAYASKHQLTYT